MTWDLRSKYTANRWWCENCSNGWETKKIWGGRTKERNMRLVTQARWWREEEDGKLLAPSSTSDGTQRNKHEVSVTSAMMMRRRGCTIVGSFFHERCTTTVVREFASPSLRRNSTARTHARTPPPQKPTLRSSSPTRRLWEIRWFCERWEHETWWCARW